jgi:hypothetical protein
MKTVKVVLQMILLVIDILFLSALRTGLWTATFRVARRRMAPHHDWKS